jgi:hypothetical protein
LYARRNTTGEKYKVEVFHVPPQEVGDRQKHEQNQNYGVNREGRRISCEE